MGYTKDVIKGVGWIGSFRIITRIMSLARIAVIGRFLSPFQVGVYGIAALVLSLIEIITETGINIILVQTQEKFEKYVNTAWVVSIIRGILISLCIVGLAPAIAYFFRTPDALYPVLLIAFVPLLRGFINPSIARFQKDLHFHKEFIYRTSLFFIESIVSIVLVISTRSPISLVWGLVIGAIVEIILSFTLVTPRPRFSYNKEIFQKIVNRGKWLTAGGIFNYLFYNGDNIVVGRMLGTSALGLYDMAYRLSILPITEIADVLARVTFPVFTKISGDISRLRTAFLKTTLVITTCCLPIATVLYFFSKEIIILLLGAQWVGAADILKILAVFGSIRAISGSSGSVFLAVNKQEYITAITFTGVVILGILIIPCIIWFGVNGAAFAALFASIAVLPVVGYYLIKVFKV